MKLLRLAGALLAVVLTASPSMAAEQSSFVMPTAGPHTMADLTANFFNPAFRALASCSWGTSAPTNGPSGAPILYQCWADTTTNPVVFKIYDGASWVVAGKLNTSSHVWTPSYQGTDLGTASTALTGTSGHTVGFLDGNNTYSGTGFFSSQFGLSGVITPTALAADQNDYNPTSLSGAAIIRQDGGAADRNITGLSGGIEGRIVEIINVGATNNLILKDQSSSSSAANRFLHGSDLTLGVNKSIVLRYDGVSSRWRTFDRGLGNTGVTAASYGSATQVGTFTVDIAGRISAAANVTIAPPFSSITGSISCSQLAALTGDVTSSAGSCVTALGNIPSGTTMAGSLLASAIAAPTTPATGKASLYVDSTAKRFHDKNDAGVIGTTVVGDSGAANNYISAIDPATGAITKSRPACSTLSDSAASCNTDTTNASNISSGTLASARLPSPTSSLIGGVKSIVSATHKWINSIGTDGTPTQTQPAAADLSDGTTGSGGAVVLASAPTVSNQINTGVSDNQGARKDSTQSTPAQIAADQNDYNPSSVICSTSTTLLINSDAARNITGFAGGVAGCDLYLINNGSFTITLKDGSVSSSAANRLGLGADFSLLSKSGAHLKYDGGSSLWRNVTGSGTGGGGGGTVSSITPGSGLVASITASCSQSAITTSGTLSAAECPNAQSGTSYAILDTDRAKLITATNAAAQAYSIAQAGAASAFQSGWFVDIQNLSTIGGAGVVTITPTTSTINGASTYKLFPTQGARIVSDGTNYQVIPYSLGGGEWVLLNVLTASTSASLQDTTSLTSLYDEYEIEFENILPATASTNCELQVHSGGSYQTTSYLSTLTFNSGAGQGQSAPTTYIPCNAGTGNNSGVGVNGFIRVHAPSNTSISKLFTGQFAQPRASNTNLDVTNVGGFWNGGTGAVDGFQVLFSSGNITSGTIRVYGRR